MQRQLAGSLDGVAITIEHIGSTAVPGLAAKPTIDILVVVASLDDVVARVPSLETLGFSYRPDNTHVGQPDHLFFRRVVDGKRTHHLHVVADGSPEIASYRLFRDTLRNDPVLALEYEQLKVRLASDHATERALYVATKEQWVTEQLNRLTDGP